MSLKSENIFMQAASSHPATMCVRNAKQIPMYGWFSDLETMKANFLNLPIIAILIAAAILCPESSSAVLSNEQRVVAEAWSVVDSTFVDRTFNDNDWMSIRQKLVKRDYKSREAVMAAILQSPVFVSQARLFEPGVRSYF
jgi:hypothetical protein